MKKLLPLFTLAICLSTVVMLFSCSSAWHLGTGNVKNNLVQWKADKQAKKAEKAAAHNTELTKN